MSSSSVHSRHVNIPKLFPFVLKMTDSLEIASSSFVSLLATPMSIGNFEICFTHTMFHQNVFFCCFVFNYFICISIAFCFWSEYPYSAIYSKCKLLFVYFSIKKTIIHINTNELKEIEKKYCCIINSQLNNTRYCRASCECEWSQFIHSSHQCESHANSLITSNFPLPHSSAYACAIWCPAFFFQHHD